MCNEHRNYTKKLTIGAAQKDAKLVEEIIQFQRSHNLPTGAEAVRVLCKYALDVKKVN